MENAIEKRQVPFFKELIEMQDNTIRVMQRQNERLGIICKKLDVKAPDRDPTESVKEPQMDNPPYVYRLGTRLGLIENELDHTNQLILFLEKYF